MNIFWLCVSMALEFAGAPTAPPAQPAAALEVPMDLALRYAREVDRRLVVPAAEQVAYAAALEDALAQARSAPSTGEYVVLVDRNPHVQAVMIFWRPAAGQAVLIGASPASTGKPGEFEHFETPLGVFLHAPANPDFRAEGTKNELGVRGYGEQGMRVYDFGWVDARRTWDRQGASPMRLQLHSTDPSLLEARLGTAQSKGCVRIPASLNDFIDRYGVLDAEYEAAVAEGRSFRVLEPDRTPVPWPGRYLVVIHSPARSRPEWSPPPARR